MIAYFADRRASLLHAALVLFGYATFHTFFFSPVVFGGRLLMNSADGYLYHYPALFGGRSLWDPLLFSGFPRFADPQMMLWYPLALPLSLTGWEGLWNPFMLAPYVLASCFTYGFVWTMTRSSLAATVAGCVYGLSGFMIAHLSHVAIIHSAAWLPLIVWSLDELRRRFHRGWFAALAIAVANAFLAGHVQIFVYGLMLGGLFVVWHMPGAASGWWRYGLSAASGVALGLGLSAVQLLPTAQLAPRSQRSALTYSEFTAYSFPRRQLPQLIFPFAYGGTNLEPSAWLAADSASVVPYLGDENLGELSGFCGLLSGVLAIVGFLGGLRARATWFWALIAFLALVLALGSGTPLARALYHVPVLNQFRCPARFLLWLGLAVAVLAGRGIGTLQTLPRREGAWRLVVAGLMVCGIVGLAGFALARQMTYAKFIHDLDPSRSALPWRNSAVGMPLIVLALGLAVLGAWYVRPGRATGAILAAAVVLDLGLFAWFFEWRAVSVPAAALRSIPEPVAGLAQDLRRSNERLLTLAPMIRVAETASSRSKDPLRLAAAPTNLSALWGVANGLGYTPLALERYSRLVPPASPSCHSKIDELLAFHYFVSPVRTRLAHGVTWDQDQLEGPRLGRDPAASSVTFDAPAILATQIGLISGMGCAVDLPDGAAVAEVVILTPSGPLGPIPLVTGVHLAECCWERSDVQCNVRHHLPELTESHEATDDEGKPFRLHLPVAFLDLGARVTVTGVQLRWVGPRGPVLIPMHMTLVDDLSGDCHPISHLAASWDHWRPRGCLPDQSHLVLENRRALRRAWLTSEVVSLSPPQIAACVLGEGPLPDGSPFEPYGVALVEEPLVFRGGPRAPGDTVQITGYEPQKVTLATHASSESFLVLGDVHYPGWQARVDGVRQKIYQTDYILRGLVVPPGDHVVEFVFRPKSLYIGAALTCLSGFAVLLLALPRGLRERISGAGPRATRPRPS